MKINFTKLNDTAIVPTRGTEESAGMDLYADIDFPVTIKPNETVKIPTNIAMEIPVNYFGGVFARSGLAYKKGLAPVNKVGVIDADYRGSIDVCLHNYSVVPQVVSPQDRIAQLIIIPFQKVELNEVNSLEETERGGGGFGSTGK